MSRIAALFVVCLLLRVIALDADPPSWLSWSMALQTDEGFYTLDARHEALFGTPAPGDFHDRLLSPLLSVVQQGVFSVFGADIVPARLISVAFGMLTLAVFWYGLRRAYGDGAAWWGTLLLGLAPPVVFYNRLALQETPAVFWLVLGFALCAVGRGTEARRRQAAIVILSGGCLAVAVIFKALAMVALPAFLCAWWVMGRRSLGWGLAGVVAALCLYAVLWAGPHHTQLARMSAFYWQRQFEPHSLASLGWNIRRGFVNGQRGLLPYLLLFLPVPIGLIACSLRSGVGREALPWLLWLAGGVGFCLLSSYAPDRYYVLFYPALAALAAMAAVRLTRRWQGAALGLFLLSSGFWVARAWQGRTFYRQTTARELAKTIPVSSLLVGEMAPALCLDTPFRAAPVQPGLSNDDRPLEKLGADYALVTRTPGSELWWRAHEPATIQPSRLAGTLRLGGRWATVVDVYAVKK